MQDPNPRDQQVRAHLALASVQLCFGLFPLFGKLAFEAFGPSAVAGWRILFGSAVLLLLAFARHGRDAMPTWDDMLKMAGLALLGVAGNQLLFLEALKRSTAVNAGLMMLLIPAFTFAIAVSFRQETWRWMRGIGILIAIAGTLPLTLQKGPDLSRPYLVGNLLFVCNTLLYSCYVVWSKPIMGRYPALVVLAWMYALCLWTVPVTCWNSDWFPAKAGHSAWLSLAAILLLPTILGYLLHLYALARVRASTTAVYIFAQPLVAGVAGWAFLGESLTTATWCGGVAMFAGVWLALRKG